MATHHIGYISNPRIWHYQTKRVSKTMVEVYGLDFDKVIQPGDRLHAMMNPGVIFAVESIERHASTAEHPEGIDRSELAFTARCTWEKEVQPNQNK